MLSSFIHLVSGLFLFEKADNISFFVEDNINFTANLAMKMIINCSFWMLLLVTSREQMKTAFLTLYIRTLKQTNLAARGPPSVGHY